MYQHLGETVVFRWCQDTGSLINPSKAQTSWCILDNRAVGEVFISWGLHVKADSKIRQLVQENSKPQDIIVYIDGSVTKDQSGWGFTVKQGVTTIHEDSATL